MSKFMSKKLTVEIAKRLKAARKAIGYKSAKDFASKENIPASTYSQHETGARSINAELIITYSNKFQVSPYWLLTGDGEPYFGNVTNKQKSILEKENYSMTSLNSDRENQHKLIHLELLRKILFAMEPLFEDNNIKLSFNELINYCFDVYDIVSTITADSEEKDKIINLTISALQRGSKSDIKLRKDKFCK